MTDSSKPSTRSSGPTFSSKTKIVRSNAPASHTSGESARSSSFKPRKNTGTHSESPAILFDEDSKKAYNIQITKPNAQRFQAFAPCPSGLENLLVHELQRLGAQKVKADRAGVHFESTWIGILKANLHSRIATRILLQVGQAPIAKEDDLYRCAAAIPWEDWFRPEKTIRVDTTAIRSPFQSIQFANLRVKDAVCDRFRQVHSERPSVDTYSPDIRIHSFITAEQAILYLDTSGESLFKRGWRISKGSAPIRENLAAGLIALVDWQPHQALLDPFCGSGTLLIEAALKAYGVPPGFSRSFAFENFHPFPNQEWQRCIAEAEALIAPRAMAPIAGADIDPDAIAAAKANAERAGLTEEDIYFEVADARDTCPLDTKTGWIVTNPPYGERLELLDPQLMHEWSSTLKQHFHHWQLAVISSDRGLPGQLRLKEKRKIPIYNGDLDCRLFQFDITSGSYRKT